MAIISRSGVRGMVCSQCRTWKPLDDYPPDGTHGLSQSGNPCRCRACYRAAYACGEAQLET